MQCGRGRGIGEILDGYEECEVPKAFQPRHAHSLQAARVGVASPCSQPEEVPLVVGVRQPMWRRQQGKVWLSSSFVT